MTSNESTHPPQLAAGAFVSQFYKVLQETPRRAYQFYKESSSLGRPDTDDVMDCVTTLRAIKGKILALDFRELAVDVMAVDAQKSLAGGMTVLVRGSLTGKNMVKKEFAQFFFLAMQEGGFFVLNDIVRYVDGKNQLVRPSQSKLERIPACNVSASHQSAAAGSYPPAKMVGDAFVQQYYNIVHQAPQFAYCFYQECSTLGRSDPYGVMGSVTTMNEIKAKFLEMNFKNFHVDIKTIDAQESLRGGVAILVIGSIIRKNVVKHFIQSFFLAPQEKGYFVLNDIFRYVDDDNRWLGSVDMLTELFKCTRLNKNNTIPSAHLVPNPLHLDPKASEASAPAGPPVSEDITDTSSKRIPEDPKEGSSNSVNTSESCVICWDARAEGACIPCGHMAGCMSCLNKIVKKKSGCPVCRAKVAQVVRIYTVW